MVLKDSVDSVDSVTRFLQHNRFCGNVLPDTRIYVRYTLGGLINLTIGIVGLDKVALKTEIWASFKQEVNDMYILFTELAF